MVKSSASFKDATAATMGIFGRIRLSFRLADFMGTKMNFFNVL
jgi:hypothetical protein